MFCLLDVLRHCDVVTLCYACVVLGKHQLCCMHITYTVSLSAFRHVCACCLLCEFCCLLLQVLDAETQADEDAEEYIEADEEEEEEDQEQEMEYEDDEVPAASCCCLHASDQCCAQQLQQCCAA